MTEKMICLIASTLTMQVASVILFTRLSEFRFDRRKTVLALAAFTVLSCAVCIGGAIPNDCERTTQWTLLTGTLPCVICFFIVSKYRGIRFFTTYCIADVSVALVDFFAYLFVLRFFDGNFTIDWIIRCIAMIGWSAALYFLIGDRYRKALTMLKKGWWLMFLCVLGMYVLMSVLSAYPAPIALRVEDTPVAMLVTAVMGVMLLVVIRVLSATLEAKEKELAQQALQSQLTMAQDRYTLLSESVGQMRRLRHDIKYHVSVVNGLVERKDYDALCAYLKDFGGQAELLSARSASCTENQPVDLLTQYYVRKARDQGIEVETEIRVAKDLPVNGTHMTTLLGNLWQNALEACAALPTEGRRYIRFTMRVLEGKLVVKCENAAPETRMDSDGHYLSTKGAGRGTGLTSVEHIAALYHGQCILDSRQGVFTAAVVLELAED